jgi:hypothetical protein
MARSASESARTPAPEAAAPVVARSGIGGIGGVGGIGGIGRRRSLRRREGSGESESGGASGGEVESEVESEAR